MTKNIYTPFNFTTGSHYITNDAVGNTPLTIKGFLNQTSTNLIDFLKSDLTPVASISAAGDGFFNGSLNIGTSTSLGRLTILNTSSGVKGLVVKGASNQSVNLQEWQVSGNTIPVAYVTQLGDFTTTKIITAASARINYSSTLGTLSLQTTDSSTIGAVIRGVVGQTVNLQEWQSFNGLSGVTVASIDNSGKITAAGDISSSGLITATSGVATSAIKNTSQVATIVIGTNNKNIQLAGSTLDAGNGSGVIGITNATTAPTANSSAGGILWVEGGALKYLGSTGSAVVVVNSNSTLPGGSGSGSLGYIGSYQTTSSAPAVTGTGTVTGSSITISGASATSSSNGADSATGGDLILRGGAATLSGSSTGEVLSGNVIIDSSNVTAIGEASYRRGHVGIGITTPTDGTTIPSGYAQSVTVAANTFGESSVLNGFSSPTRQSIDGLVNIGTHGTNQVNIGSSDTWSGALTVNIMNKTGGDVKTLNLANNGGATTVKMATGASSSDIRLGVGNTSSTIYTLGKLFIWQPLGGTASVPASPTSYLTPAQTLSTTELKTLIIQYTGATSGSFTLPNGTTMDAGVQNLLTATGIDWTFINTNSGTATITSPGSSHIIIGNGAVAANTSGRFRSVRSTTNVWVTFRLS